ncbi:prenyltransferase [Nocardia vermiculata]|uniref:Prenyltransferase n=1 Tax=Nocardia vermiculata TaxID=257274 RepID=A0A846XSS3_9NOCA|nr:prenyltransferase [Nocardia vermiculata]NKY50126.1 prenyltransferase [Nocardia vermiculata]
MRGADLPSIPGVVSGRQVLITAESIAAQQHTDGSIPWFQGGHTDPWDHVESAMALTVAGLRDSARAAYDWSANTQRADGSWPQQFRGAVVENPDTDTNFCAYIAAGVWHYYLSTGDLAFADSMWPTVRAGIDYVISLQRGGNGEIYWLQTEHGFLPEALLTGCSSMFHSICCGLALAELLGIAQPEWEVAALRLGHALRHHPEAFAEKDRYSMDWYYPVLCGALRGAAGHARIAARWNDFVVGEIGIRCVSDRPWVTGAETCELVLALDTLGDAERAHRLLASMQHLREDDGSYWTGLVFADGKRWPEERTTWTGAAMVLAADALTRTTPGNGIFRDPLPGAAISTGGSCDCAASRS